jgi:hypothetical protein
VAHYFTKQVESAAYGSDDIADAREVLAQVDYSFSSVVSAKDAADALIVAMIMEQEIQNEAAEKVALDDLSSGVFLGGDTAAPDEVPLLGTPDCGMYSGFAMSHGQVI